MPLGIIRISEESMNQKKQPKQRGTLKPGFSRLFGEYADSKTVSRIFVLAIHTAFFSCLCCHGNNRRNWPELVIRFCLKALCSGGVGRQNVFGPFTR
jgi:hypothetical protein